MLLQFLLMPLRINSTDTLIIILFCLSTRDKSALLSPAKNKSIRASVLYNNHYGRYNYLSKIIEATMNERCTKGEKDENS